MLLLGISFTEGLRKSGFGCRQISGEQGVSMDADTVEEGEHVAGGVSPVHKPKSLVHPILRRGSRCHDGR